MFFINYKYQQVSIETLKFYMKEYFSSYDANFGKYSNIIKWKTLHLKKPHKPKLII